MNLRDLLTIAEAYVLGLFRVRIFKIDWNLYQSGHLEGLWSECAVRNAEIKGIVDLEGSLDKSSIRKDLDWYVYWHISDGPIANIDKDKLWDVARQIQEKTLQGMKVLVHCQGGVNRSSLVNGCVINLRGWIGRTIVTKIRRGRPGALTNYEFREYLENLT